MERFEDKVSLGGKDLNILDEQKKKEGFEIMKTPEIVVRDERGAQLFSLILKAEDPNWGDTKNPLAKETVAYFKDNPLTPEIKSGIQELRENGVDEESLYNFALAYKNPERLGVIFEMAAKHKPHIKTPQEVQQKFFDILQSFDQTFSSSSLSEKLQLAAEQDKDKRLGNMEETRKRMSALIDFFKPDPKTTKTTRVNFMPTNPLYKKNSGRNFSLGTEQIILSHVDNIVNQDHEFLHGVVNPVVDKLFEKLTDKQQEKILGLASGKLKLGYKYPYSILCEELINTFNDVFRKGEKPETYDDFKEKISSISEEAFQEEFSRNKILKATCDELGIASLEDLKNKSQEYFEWFEKNQLRGLVLEFYQEYSTLSNTKEINFERFVLEKFPDKL